MIVVTIVIGYTQKEFVTEAVLSRSGINSYSEYLLAPKMIGEFEDANEAFKEMVKASNNYDYVEIKTMFKGVASDTYKLKD